MPDGADEAASKELPNRAPGQAPLSGEPRRSGRLRPQNPDAMIIDEEVDEELPREPKATDQLPAGPTPSKKSRTKKAKISEEDADVIIFTPRYS